jgi:hypothetical protein
MSSHAALVKSFSIFGYDSLAIYHFKQRRISLFDRPSFVRRSTYCWVRESLPAVSSSTHTLRDPM